MCLCTSEEDDPSKWEIEETVRFDDLYDQDKDGKLNREEQLRWVAPNSYGSAREEVSNHYTTVSLHYMDSHASLGCSRSAISNLFITY